MGSVPDPKIGSNVIVFVVLLSLVIYSVRVSC